MAKTFRGVVASITMTTAIAPLIGISWQLGLLTAILAMTGDLVASFVKRRLGYRPSERASGLDQIPESLLPAAAIAPFLPLTLSEIAAVVLLFSVASPIASRLLFHIGIRDKPY